MSATDVIAVIALVVSIGAGAAAIVSLVLQFRESKRRDEELELLRQQVEGQQEDRRRHERGRLSVFAGVAGERRGGGLEYRVPVQNVGEADASQITVELVDGGGVKIGSSAQIVALVPGQKAYATVVTPSVFAGPYEVFFEWDDGRPERNRAASGVQVGEP
jgi:hypothetical protein